MEINLEMGKVHTSKDKEITGKKVAEIERNLNGHASMWIKMWGVGEHHNHTSRVRESRITHSKNIASMTLLLKDHKKDLSSRPVVSGNTSNTRGMSIMVSQVLESVADSFNIPFEVISTEDLLAAIHNLNRLLDRLPEVNGGTLKEEN